MFPCLLSSQHIMTSQGMWKSELIIMVMVKKDSLFSAYFQFLAHLSFPIHLQLLGGTDVTGIKTMGSLGRLAKEEDGIVRERILWVMKVKPLEPSLDYQFFKRRVKFLGMRK